MVTRQRRGYAWPSRQLSRPALRVFRIGHCRARHRSLRTTVMADDTAVAMRFMHCRLIFDLKRHFGSIDRSLSGFIIHFDEIASFTGSPGNNYRNQIKHIEIDRA
ncbi:MULTISPECIES: hypothetical protein [unclassified Burkholderia]|uniref:hypothetical protein n=1 Tax=unclassified Burkholderia TaxID=2613784 RepID=UPI002AB238F2|nr:MULTISPECIES: hypothetical protein [unclassified Burkholderia]